MRHLFILLVFIVVSFSGNAESHETVFSAHTGVFIENNGQLHDQNGKPRPDLDFCLDGIDAKVFVGDGGLHYQFCRSTGRPKPGPDSDLEIYRLDVALVGADRNAAVVKGAVAHYYERHYTPDAGDQGLRVAATERITYKNVYPNIDWVLYARGGRLKHEFIVHEGGRVSDIRIRYEGASKLRLSNEGKLIVQTPFGEVEEAAPISFDERNVTVSSSYCLEGNVLTYKVGAFIGGLTIDPSVSWSTYYGGTGTDYGEYTVTDPAGNVYLLLYGPSAGLATTGAFLTTVAGSNDGVIVKFNALGVRQWSTYYGGAGSENLYGGATDVAGNLYVVGSTYSSTGIATAGTFDPVYSPGTTTSSDGFMAKFDNTGARLWGTYYGGTQHDYISAVTVSGAGDVYICGGTQSTSSIASAGAHQTILGSSSLSDGFIAKFTSSGSRVWGTYYGGNSSDATTNIKCDASGKVYVVGFSYSPSAIATAGSHQPVHGATSGPDAFLVKFNSDGVRQWGTYYGGNQWDMGFALDVDEYKNVYIGGDTRSLTAIATPGAQQTSLGGGSTTYSDCFLAKFDSTGTRLWGTYYGGDKNDRISSIAINGPENIVVAGETASTTGISTSGSAAALFNGFYAKFSSLGVRQWGAYIGGSSDDYVYSVANVSGGGFYLAGKTSSTSGIATAGAFQTVMSSASDAFLSKISDCLLPDAGTISGASVVCVSGSMTLAVPVTGGAWSATNARATVSATGVVVGVTPGLDTIRYTVTNSCGTTIASKVVTVSATAGTISGATSVCVGANISLGASVGGGTWSSGATAIANVGSGSGAVNGVATGTSMITYVIPGCFVTRVVTVNPLPPAISGALAVCVGSTTTLTDATPGGSWISGSSLVATIGTSSGTAIGVSAGVADIIYVLPTGCYTVSELTVNPLPAVITGATAVCAGATTPLSSATPGGTWTSTSGITIGSATGVVTGISVGTAIATYTISTGCYVTHTLTINASPAPIAGTLMACAGGAMTLTCTPSGGAWTSGGTSVATVGLGTGAVVAVGAGTANITYSLTNGCRAVAMVSVYAIPTSITGTATVCVGDSTTLACTAAGGSWSSGSVGIATVGSTTGKVYGVAAGTVSVTYAMPAGCMTSRVVTVNAVPSAITGTALICEGNATALASTPSGGTWSSSPSTVASVGSLSGVVAAALAGTATITYRLPTGCKTTTEVTVNAAPGAITGGAILCVGGALPLANPVAGGSWSSTGTAGSVSPMGLVTATTTGTIIVTYSMPGGCDTTVEITVMDLPAAASISGTGTVCVDQDVMLSASVPGGVWSSSNGNVGVVDGTVHGLMTGAVTINYALSNVCGSTTTGHPMTVVPASDCGVGVNAAATLETTLICYPNPSDGNVIIALQSGHKTSAQMVINDVLGRSIFETGMSTNKAVSVWLPVKGVYFVSVVAEGALFTSKVMVE